jgi:hypothetical protein
MDSAAVDHKKIAFDRHAVQLILNGIFISAWVGSSCLGRRRIC